jgi:hypothetical protein
MVPQPRTTCHSEFVAVVVAIHNAGKDWRYLPVKGAALSEGDVDGNNHGAEMSTPVSVLHQSSCKFCAGLHSVTSSTSQRHCYSRSVMLVTLPVMHNCWPLKKCQAF